MKRVWLYGGLAVVAFYSLAPLLWQFVTSLTPEHELTTLPPLLPTRASTAHYLAVLGDHPLARIIANSLIVAAGTTALALAAGSLAAFALAKLPVRGKALILLAVLATSMFPPIATVSPLYLLIVGLGLRDTLLALVLVYTSFSLPLAIWLLTAFLHQIPDELYRAARVDGCTPLQAFRRVLLPLSVPGLVATGLLVFIAAWNEFLYALTFTSTTASRTVPVEIAQFPGLHEVPWGEIAAATITVIIPLVVIAFLFQRRIVAGLTTGAVKE
ncbi:carbohydrate ABC transporter permease [Ectothiorhodospiraceae bacterium 2226]|nr:carbohydrate ABC transporter permease [Ectothiorhodospiraceae bacterium 2226]